MQGRHDILAAADECRDRVAGQRKHGLAIGPHAEPHRLARALADLVKYDVNAEFRQHLRARSRPCPSTRRRTGSGRPPRPDVRRCVPGAVPARRRCGRGCTVRETVLLEHGDHGRAVRHADLVRLDGLAGRHEFVAGRDHSNCRRCADGNFWQAAGCDDGDVHRRDARTGRQQLGALRVIRAARVHELLRRCYVVALNRGHAILHADALDRDDAVGARGSDAPVMISMHLPSSSVSAGSPAACMACNAKFALARIAIPANAIAMPSIVTRSNGGWSRSAMTACRKHPAAGFCECDGFRFRDRHRGQDRGACLGGRQHRCSAASRSARSRGGRCRGGNTHRPSESARRRRTPRSRAARRCHRARRRTARARRW